MFTLRCPYSLLLEVSWIMDGTVIMNDLEDRGLMLRMVKQKRAGVWVSKDHISKDCSPLFFFIGKISHYVQPTRAILIHLPRPTIPFRYFLKVHFKQILTTVEPGPQQHFVPYHSLPSTPLSGLP